MHNSELKKEFIKEFYPKETILNGVELPIPEEAEHIFNWFMERCTPNQKVEKCKYNCKCHDGMLGSEVYGSECGVCGCSIIKDEHISKARLVEWANENVKCGNGTVFERGFEDAMICLLTFINTP